MTVISLLLSLLILCLFAGIVYYIITLIPLPPPFGTIVQLVFLLIVVLMLVSYLLPFGSHMSPLILR